MTDCMVTKLTCYVEKMRVIMYAPMIGRVPNAISLTLAERLVYQSINVEKKTSVSRYRLPEQRILSFSQL